MKATSSTTSNTATESTTCSTQLVGGPLKAPSTKVSSPKEKSTATEDSVGKTHSPTFNPSNPTNRPDRSVYQGNFKNGVRHGTGKFIDENGRARTGVWDNDEVIKWNDDDHYPYLDPNTSDFRSVDFDQEGDGFIKYPNFDDINNQPPQRQDDSNAPNSQNFGYKSFGGKSRYTVPHDDTNNNHESGSNYVNYSGIGDDVNNNNGA